LSSFNLFKQKYFAYKSLNQTNNSIKPIDTRKSEVTATTTRTSDKDIRMPGHENWTIVSFPDHYYHLLLPKAITDADADYYKACHGAEISNMESLRSVWNYPIRPPVATRWDAFKWRSSLTAPNRALCFNVVDKTDNSVHRVRRRFRYYVKP